MNPFSSIMSSVVNPVSALQLATGPVGWASLATRVLVSQIGMNAIQQLGQQLGLPQSAIDMAQAGFASAAGMPNLAQQEIRQAVSGLAEQFDLNPLQQGQLERAANQDLDNFISSMSESQEAREARASGGRQGGNWLMALAEALGAKLDEMADELGGMAENLSKDDPSLTAKFGALSQQFGMMFNATSTAIKGIGEAMGNMARKQ